MSLRKSEKSKAEADKVVALVKDIIDNRPAAKILNADQVRFLAYHFNIGVVAIHTLKAHH